VSIIVIQKIGDTFAKLKKMEEENEQNKKEEKFWKEIEELKLPMYSIIEDSKLLKQN